MRLGACQRQWRRARGWGALLAALVMVLLCRPRTLEHVSEGRLRGGDGGNIAHAVWDFVADFSNMHLLLPHFESFHILSESGNYDHWRYSVRYWERMATWPRLRTATLAHYSVRRVDDIYLVSANHRTCFVGDYLCLNSASEFEVRDTKAAAAARGSDDERGATYRETVRYECPVLLTAVCRRDVEENRAYYFERLKNNFE